ncbi:hypothetical protein CHARACLAT_023280, partial [Characodon lateralis]|nr:hypothetical protein [Characodon lateralis]
ERVTSSHCNELFSFTVVGRKAADYFLEVSISSGSRISCLLSNFKRIYILLLEQKVRHCEEAVLSVRCGRAVYVPGILKRGVDIMSSGGP